ncbi:negative regulator of systemic acquired resistance SNI1 [Arachis hypogaea]|uniref:Uncharacterized protein n=1 Tax=Arachis hypogaea TaxID=3818 RepID=A0A445CM81_ARAHY|nr:hypothetical protein Ahy_A06g026952 isoform E [Arachis hypogaea]
MSCFLAPVSSFLNLATQIKDLDISRKKADLEGHTTRADGLRKPLMDIILDQLAYNIDTIPLFLKTFSEPKWKLEIVVHYL